MTGLCEAAGNVTEIPASQRRGQAACVTGNLASHSETSPNLETTDTAGVGACRESGQGIAGIRLESRLFMGWLELHYN
jgi:hypothetical protein